MKSREYRRRMAELALVLSQEMIGSTGRRLEGWVSHAVLQRPRRTTRGRFKFVWQAYRYGQWSAGTYEQVAVVSAYGETPDEAAENFRAALVLRALGKE